MGIKVLAFVFLIFGLAKDFSQDKKQHFKAKVLHTLMLIFLLYYFAGSFGSLGWLISHFGKFQERFHAPVGIFSADVHFFATFVHIGLSLIIILFTYRLIKRDNSAREKIIKILPLIIPTEVLSFYRGFQGDDPVGNDFLVILLGLIIISGLNLGICFLYSRSFMVAFFKGKPLPESKVQPEFIPNS